LIVIKSCNFSDLRDIPRLPVLAPVGATHYV
jgi:hypothetical protein